MKCDVVRVDGVTAFICGQRSKAKPCQEQGCRGASRFQCDFPLAGERAGKTCDRFICEKHRQPMPGGAGRDYCPTHARFASSCEPCQHGHVREAVVEHKDGVATTLYFHGLSTGSARACSGTRQ